MAAALVAGDPVPAAAGSVNRGGHVDRLAAAILTAAAAAVPAAGGEKWSTVFPPGRRHWA